MIFTHKIKALSVANDLLNVARNVICCGILKVEVLFIDELR